MKPIAVWDNASRRDGRDSARSCSAGADPAKLPVDPDTSFAARH